VLFCVLAVGLLLWLTFRHAVGILAPFLLAGLLSAVIKPWVIRLHRVTRIPRGIWSAVLVILSVRMLAALAVGGTRRGIRELSRLADELAADTEGLTAAVDKVLSRVESLSAHIPFLRRFEDAPFYDELCEGLDRLVETGVTRLTETVTARLPSAAMSVAGFLPAAFIFITVTLLACYYFTADDGGLGVSLQSAAARLLPLSAQDRLPALGRRLKRLGRQYIRACLLLGLLTFLLSFIGLAVLRVPYAFILALLLAVVDLLPLLGTGIILIPWAVISLLLGQIRLGIGLLVLYGVASLVRQILEPKLIGEGLGLHPLFSLLAMYAGLRLFGVGGMILAPLVAAGIKSAAGE
jgi:sporulation integral membrane protein YtvI